MTALLLHTTLSVVLVAWAYLVTSRVPYRRAWVWTGTALVVAVGYVMLLALFVFEGGPAAVQGAVGRIGATLLALSAVVCFVLYGLVSRGPQRPATRGATRADVSDEVLDEEESVIAPESLEDWDDELELDVRPWPTDADAAEAPRGGRYAFPSADEPEAPAPAPPARGLTSPVPPASAPTAPREWPAASRGDLGAGGRTTPRRAMPSPTDMGS